MTNRRSSSPTLDISRRNKKSILKIPNSPFQKEKNQNELQIMSQTELKKSVSFSDNNDEDTDERNKSLTS